MTITERRDRFRKRNVWWTASQQPKAGTTGKLLTEQQIHKKGWYAGGRTARHKRRSGSSSHPFRTVRVESMAAFLLYIFLFVFFRFFFVFFFLFAVSRSRYAADGMGPDRRIGDRRTGEQANRRIDERQMDGGRDGTGRRANRHATYLMNTGLKRPWGPVPVSFAGLIEPFSWTPTYQACLCLYQFGTERRLTVPSG